jgi:hypothetical protein
VAAPAANAEVAALGAAEPKATPDDDSEAETGAMVDAEALSRQQAASGHGSGGGGGGGGAEEMQVEPIFDDDGDRVQAPAKSDSPPRSLAASFRASSRPTADDMRDSGDRPARRLPRAAAANNTAVEAVRTRGAPFSARR